MANGTITMDADEFVTRLTRAKVSRPQAEAIVKGIEKDASIDTSELATKKDLEIIEERLTRKMYQTQIITIAILTGVMGIMLVMQGYFLMSLI